MLKQVTVTACTHPMTPGHQPTLESSNAWNPSLRGRRLETDWLKGEKKVKEEKK